MKALVIGGGIGGLTTALSLEAAGIEATVFEQVGRIEALGVGINLQPNAVRELTELHLAEALRCRRNRNLDADLLQQVWSGDLVGAAWACRRLRLAAIFYRPG